MNILLTFVLSSVLLLSVFSISESFASPASEWVYLIGSHEQGLKNMFGVRHNFDAGFTTVLNEHQVTALERAGLSVEKVPQYELSAPVKCDPWPACKNGGSDGGTSDRTIFPNEQTPWGIHTIYNVDVTDDTFTPSGGNGVVVAVLDTGVNKNHLDLKNRLVDCQDFTKGPSPKKTCTDDNGHGTHVAGTILADGGSDGNGIYGVAPEASLMSLKVCSSLCWSDDIAAAINYAGQHGANIVSMSLGGDTESSLIRDAIAANQNVLYIAAAGNDGQDGNASIDYPGANPSVIAVGAIDINHQVPYWSSLGDIALANDLIIDAKEVELGAPGVNVYSTWNDGGYNIISGTSMATPHISGLAAKIWSGVESTRIALQNIADPSVHLPGFDTATGFGLPAVP